MTPLRTFQYEVAAAASEKKTHASVMISFSCSSVVFKRRDVVCARTWLRAEDAA